MPTVKVEGAERSMGLYRFSYPVRLTLDDGTDVNLHKYYSDFVALHSSLLNSLTETLPTLPEKKWDGRSRVRDRRRAAFQYFLDWCLIHAKNDPSILAFFNVRSLGIQAPVIEVIERADIPDSVLTGRIGGSEQNFLKLAFFAMFWLLTWRAMITAPQPKAAPTNMVLTLIANNETSTLMPNLEQIVPNQFAKVVLIETTVSIDEKVPEDVVVSTEMGSVLAEDESEHAREVKNDVETVTQAAPLADLPESESNKSELPVELEKIIEVDVPLAENVIVNEKIEKLVDSLPVQQLEDSQQETGISEPKSTPAKQQVEFLFGPLHGVIAFFGLYIAVLAWSCYYPPATERLATVEIAFHGQDQSVDPASNDATNSKNSSGSTSPSQSKLHTPRSSTPERKASMTFEEAQELFHRLPLISEQDELDSSRAMAFLMRATGKEPSTNPSIKVLTQFWEEASAISPMDAEQRFIQIVSRRFPLTTDDQESSSIVSNASAMDVFSPQQPLLNKPIQAVRWWDSNSQQLVKGENVEDDSNITSFDSTDISSLSVSPSPIRQPQQKEQGRPTIIRFAEPLLDDEIHGAPKSTMRLAGELAVGTVIGIATAAFALSATRRIRGRFI